jgi:dTDP-glucose 4,6-dehydratase
VLDFARERGVGELLYLSSGAVYGRQPPGLERMPETFGGAPDGGDFGGAYAAGKREGERLCAGAAQGGALRPKIARGFAFVGPHLPLDLHFAAGNFLRDALRGSEIVVQGDGTPYRAYLHAADLVVWLVTILVRGEALRAYNVGSDQAVSIAELARLVAGLANPPVRVQVRGTPTGKPAERYVPAVDRARKELGLEVRIGLSDAFERTYRWLQ